MTKIEYKFTVWCNLYNICQDGVYLGTTTLPHMLP